MIKMVSVNMISHHPDNPRKKLGDLTELANSIKENGVMQNLTLVPWFSIYTGVGADDPTQQEKMGYYAVIGNRRLAAAKLAGIKEVPAVIREDMDHKTQIATMLLENMQRSDLTVYEQAQGIQMMLDFGETISDISEKTGFSDSTVRRRVKLLELDQDKFKESEKRGGSLSDYADLEQIEDLELRNKVLEKIGTNDFQWSLKNALSEEKAKKKLEELLELLPTFATKVEVTKGLMHYRSIYSYSGFDFKVPEDAGEKNYYYKIDGSYIYIYTDYPDNYEEQHSEEEEKNNLRKEKVKKLEELSKRAYELRYEFAKSISNTRAKNNIKFITENLVYSMAESYSSINYEKYLEFFEIKIDKDEDEDKDISIDDISSYIHKQPERSLFATAYFGLDSERESYKDWQGNFRENEDLDKVYDLLENLGYEMSEEEIALQDGTHELFKE